LATAGTPAITGTQTTWQGANNSGKANNSRDASNSGLPEALETPLTKETSTAVGTAEKQRL
jgi:hypothetical protein